MAERKSLIGKSVELSDDKENKKAVKGQGGHQQQKHDEMLYGSQDETHANLWGRSFLIGVFYFILTVGVMFASLLYSAWLAMGLSIVVIAIFTYSSSLWKCCYTRTKRDWDTPLGRVILMAGIFGCVAGIAGGYYLREFYVASSRVSYVKLSTVSATKLNFGFGTFGVAGDGYPVASKGMATGGFLGVVETCVAPILETQDQTAVNYVAVSQGSCCGTLSCDGWNTTSGGIALRYTEFYPQTASALQTLAKKYSYSVDPDVIFVKWGTPSSTLKEDITTGTLIVGVSAIVFVVFGLYIAVSG